MEVEDARSHIACHPNQSDQRQLLVLSNLVNRACGECVCAVNSSGEPQREHCNTRRSWSEPRQQYSVTSANVVAPPLAVVHRTQK